MYVKIKKLENTYQYVFIVIGLVFPGLAAGTQCQEEKAKKNTDHEAVGCSQQADSKVLIDSTIIWHNTHMYAQIRLKC